jgi:hypothetical protein
MDHRGQGGRGPPAARPPTTLQLRRPGLRFRLDGGITCGPLLTSVTRPESCHRPSRRTCPRTQCEALHPRHKTATLIILSGAGLDTPGVTIPYVAGWGETGALEAVTEHAELIDRLARTVEKAIATDTNDNEAEAESPAAIAA